MSNGQPVNPNRVGNFGFQSTLYYKLIVKKQYPVEEVARRMNIPADTLYKYIEGRNVIPPDRVVDLIRATGDIEFLEFFCQPCGYIPVRAAQGKLYDTPHEKDEIVLTILTGKMLDEIERAHDDGVIDKQEYAAISRLATRLQEKAAEINQKIKAEVK